MSFEPSLIHEAHGGPLDGHEIFDHSMPNEGERTSHDIGRVSYFYDFDGIAWRYAGSELVRGSHKGGKDDFAEPLPRDEPSHVAFGVWSSLLVMAVVFWVLVIYAVWNLIEGVK